MPTWANQKLSLSSQMINQKERIRLTGRVIPEWKLILATVPTTTFFASKTCVSCYMGPGLTFRSRHLVGTPYVQNTPMSATLNTTAWLTAPWGRADGHLPFSDPACTAWLSPRTATCTVCPRHITAPAVARDTCTPSRASADRQGTSLGRCWNGDAERIIQDLRSSVPSLRRWPHDTAHLENTGCFFPPKVRYNDYLNYLWT